MIAEASLADLRARHPVPEIAGRWVSLRRSGKGFVGPCPLCSPNSSSRSAARFECEAEKWVCAVCNDGGDVIRLVEKHEGKTFLDAVAWLGGAQEVDPAVAERRAREAAEKKAKRERDAAQFREREMERLRELWTGGTGLPGTPAEAYLARRGLCDVRSPSLRAHDAVTYFVQAAGEDGRVRPRVLHTGPALLAAILGPAGALSGLHITWIDLDRPKGKLVLVDPAGEALPARKVRGTMQGGRIELVRHKAPRRLFIGEGIETVLSVLMALAAKGRDLAEAAFWTAIALGNLGGEHEATVPHPTAKSAAGRTTRVPGPVPKLDGWAIPIPDTVTDLVLLADGDSDRFTTECALERARARYLRPGRSVRIVWPPAGCDFNDMLVA